MSSSENERLDWNSPTSVDAKEFKVLPANTEVGFTVVEFERATTAKGDNMAKISLRCETSDGLTATIKENLVLIRNCEWRINQLFRSVGLRKHGETSVPKWGELKGSRGRARLGVEQWVGKDGKTYDGNVIKDYLEPNETAAAESDEDLF